VAPTGTSSSAGITSAITISTMIMTTITAMTMKVKMKMMTTKISISAPVFAFLTSRAHGFSSSNR
jgi:hypothetical protein